MEEKKYICKGCGRYLTSEKLIERDEMDMQRPVKDCFYRNDSVTAAPACVLVEITDEEKELYDKLKAITLKFE